MMIHIKTILATVVLICSTSAFAEVLFEGAYRIEEAGRHVGYVIQRYSIDSQTKKRTMTTFLRRKYGEKYVETRIKTVAKDNFEPLTSSYSSNESGTPLSVDADFEGRTPVLELTVEGAKQEVDEKDKLKTKPAFLSNFLMYVVAANYKGNLNGFPVKSALPYSAYSEEEGKIDTGTLRRMADKGTNGHKIIQFVDTFGNEPIELFVVSSGDMVGVRNKDTVIYLVRDAAEAIGIIEPPGNHNLTAHFGDLPLGIKHPFGEKASSVYSTIKSFKTLEEERAPNGVTELPALKIPAVSK
jgi:hypothetical protein